MKNGWIKMLFPAYELTRIDNLAQINNIMGVNALEAYKSENGWIVVRVGSEKEVLNASPDFEAIREKELSALTAVSAVADSPGYDFVVRVFCNPKYGITEDSVTGAANCILAPYWPGALRKTSFTSKQLSMRTGQMKVNLVDNKVEILGQAVTVFEIDMPQSISCLKRYF